MTRSDNEGTKDVLDVFNEWVSRLAGPCWSRLELQPCSQVYTPVITCCASHTNLDKVWQQPHSKRLTFKAAVVCLWSVGQLDSACSCDLNSNTGATVWSQGVDVPEGYHQA